MHKYIQTSFAILLMVAVSTWPATSVQAEEIPVPEKFDLKFLVGFIAEVIDGVQEVLSPSETASNTQGFDGGIEPVRNGSEQPDGGPPNFGGQIEPVGDGATPEEGLPNFGGGIEPVG